MQALTRVNKSNVDYPVTFAIFSSESASELNRFGFHIGIVDIGSEPDQKSESVTSLENILYDH